MHSAQPTDASGSDHRDEPVAARRWRQLMA